jgi:hypothetical protein
MSRACLDLWQALSEITEDGELKVQMRAIGHGVLGAILLTMPASWSLAAPSASSVDTLRVGQPLPRAALLLPGVHRYVRYIISGDSRRVLDLWSRQLSYEDKDGQRLMHIVQRWDAADKSYVAIFDQTFEAKTFKPLAQSQTVTRSGATKVLSVVFAGSKVDSNSDDTSDHGKPVHEKFDMEFYNWHTDMELLQALPLKKDYVASIPFYDVGQEPPARYTYSVVGDDTIPSPDGAPIDCWVVVFKSPTTNDSLRFWFAKRNQVLVREEAPVPGEGILVKTLLNAEAEPSKTG